MSDLSTRPRDQRLHPTLQIQGAQPWSSDLQRGANDRGRWLLLGAVLTLGCPRPPGPTPGLDLTAPRELWVDGSAPAGGDGTKERPLKAVPVLDGGLHLHLRSGLYPGPFEFPAGTHVTGHGVPVLFLEGDGVVVRTGRGPVRLERLLVQGGGVGLRSDGALVLEHVKVSGHRRVAIEGHDAGLDAVALEVTSQVPGTTGVLAEGGWVRLHGATLSGPMKRGLEARGAAVEVRDLRSEGPSTGILTVKGSLDGVKLTLAGGQAAALHVLDATTTLREVDVTGHEYALLGSGTITVDGLVSRAPQQGGLSLLEATSTLRHVRVERAGGMGGLQLLGGSHALDDVVVTDSQAWAVLVRKGKARIGRLQARALRGEGSGADRVLGDGLVVRDGTVTIDTLAAEDLEGSALFASHHATVTVTQLDAQRCGGGAAFVDHSAAVVVTNLKSRGALGPSVTVLDGARLRVGTFSATGGDVSVWADCSDGVRVDVKQPALDTPLPALRCLFTPLRPTNERQ
jgi:hypothetical protein